jgi:hypothetical protein
MEGSVDKRPFRRRRRAERAEEFKGGGGRGEGEK